MHDRGRLTEPRFAQKTVRRASGCIEWVAAKNRNGYGKCADGKGGWVLAHRHAWIVVHGTIPVGKEVCHICDNPSCVNIHHLFLGSHAENMADAKKKGRARGAAGMANGRAKLTDNDVRRIRKSNETVTALADRYGVSHVMISKIRRRVAWASVPDSQEAAA